jgi:hypothetical protein
MLEKIQNAMKKVPPDSGLTNRSGQPLCIPCTFTKCDRAKINEARSNQRRPAIRSAVVWRTECNQERNQLREALQPLKSCRDPRLR